MSTNRVASEAFQRENMREVKNRGSKVGCGRSATSAFCSTLSSPVRVIRILTEQTRIQKHEGDEVPEFFDHLQVHCEK